MSSPATPAPTRSDVQDGGWHNGDLAWYAYRSGWGGGAISQAAALVRMVSPTAKTCVILVYNKRTNRVNEITARVTSLAPRTETNIVDIAFRSYIELERKD